MMRRARFGPVLAAVILFTGHALAGDGARFLVEAEAFQFSGQWFRERDGSCLGGTILRATASASDAVTVIELPQAGEYRVWTRARDFARDQTSTRRFQVLIDGQAVDRESGQHGKDGWAWELVGQLQLAAGRHVLALRDTRQFFPRCDAILLATDDVDPNTLRPEELAKSRLGVKTIAARFVNDFPATPSAPAGLQEVARLENGRVKLIFQQGRDGQNRERLIRRTELLVNGQGQPIPLDPVGERLFLIYSPASGLNAQSLIPGWKNGRDQMEFEVEGRRYLTSAGGTNPYVAGHAQELLAVRCRPVEGNAVEVDYESVDGRRLTGRFELLPGRTEVRFALRFTADQDGEYSLGLAAFQGWAKDQVQINLLPPMYQFQRLPDRPNMVTSTLTSHPLALVQAAVEGFSSPVSFAVVADPGKLPYEWATPVNAKYGFSLLNTEGKVQPGIFSPILGMPDSKLKAGESREVSWLLLASLGDWKQTLEYSSQTIFAVRDERQPRGASLTDAALNMVDLMKDPHAGGWDARLKGFYNIESRDTVTHASPLTIVSAAVLSDDESLYAQRALPTIEYMLSRPGPHFAVDVPTDELVNYVKPADTQVTIPSRAFGTAVWQGLHDLLGRANPHLAGYATVDGQVRWRTGALPKWSELLAEWRLQPSEQRLKQVQAECDAWIAKEVFGRQTKEIGAQPFYNVTFYPYWWDLLDLYELTGKAAYLQAAEESAFHTIAGQWCHPVTPAGELTIHPGGQYPFKRTLRLWKGDAEYEVLKAPTPQKQVPAWVVSRVGLGFEQPVTYFASGGEEARMRNIMMSCWAPHLLRLYGQTGREIYLTYARNSVIGRFGNYPGYYLNGQTDVAIDPRFPYQGPDVTSVYYHHIPPHLAFTIDFLVAEASVRSKAAISFPWVKQQGYVWFSNRVYGHAPGKVFGDESVRLRLDRKLVQVGSDQVNYLLGRGKDKWWVILMNESDAEQSAPLRLNVAAAKLRTDRPLELYDAAGRRLGDEPMKDVITVKVPAKGLLAVALPAEPEAEKVLPPVADGHQVQDLPGDWKQLHAFRIRSPFGKDSLYVVLTGRPTGDVSARLLLDGHSAPVQAKAYPFEFSVYPWPMDRDLTFTVELKDAAGNETRSTPITLSGTRP